MSVVENVVFGLAFGDAMGYPTEFQSFEELAAKEQVSVPGYLVSDDTQMSLSVMAAVLDHWDVFDGKKSGSHELSAEEWAVWFAQAFVVWKNDPRNHRAPGMTCLEGVGLFESAVHRSVTGGVSAGGFVGEQVDSKGCGANMRSGWLGLLPLESGVIEQLAVVQARVTHGHPLALASAAVTALVVQALAQEWVYAGDVFDWVEKDLIPSLEVFPGSGLYAEGIVELDEVWSQARDKYEAYLQAEGRVDVCSFMGQGWVAEEALLCAVAVVDKFGGRVNEDGVSGEVLGLIALADSGGDSDSIAAIGGAFLGAGGLNGWPQEWYGLLEADYTAEMRELVGKVGSL